MTIDSASRENVKRRYKALKSIKKVATELHLAWNTVSKIVHDPSQPGLVQKQGRPRKLSERTKHLLKRKFQLGELKSSQEGADFVEALDSKKVSKSTVLSCLRSSGMRSYRMQKKPFISKKNHALRLKFAKNTSTGKLGTGTRWCSRTRPVSTHLRISAQEPTGIT